MFESCGGCCLAIIVIPLLCVALVACAVIYVVTNAPDAPVANDFKPSTVEAAAFDQVMTGAAAQARTQGWWVIQFTEREMSSWLALEGESFADEHDRYYPFKNVQVGLDDDQMTFYGEFDARAIDLPIEVVVEPTITPAGKMEFNITSANLSGIRLPNALLDSVTDQFQDIMVQPFDDLPGNYYFWPQSLVIDNGTFAVQGQIVP